MAKKKTTKPKRDTKSKHKRTFTRRDRVMERIQSLEQQLEWQADTVAKLVLELSTLRQIARSEAELQVEDETMVYRKLIHTLIDNRKNVDRFLDVLGDFAPDIRKALAELPIGKMPVECYKETKP